MRDFHDEMRELTRLRERVRDRIGRLRTTVKTLPLYDEVSSLPPAEQTTDHASPHTVNNQLIFHGPVYGSQIQQATTESAQVLEAVSPQVVDAVRNWAARVRDVEASLMLTADSLDTFDKELSALEARLTAPSPKRSRLRSSVQAVGAILTVAAGETTALELVKELPQILQLLSHLG